MMQKWLKPKRNFSLRKQLERETQKMKEALHVQEFNKHSVRVVTRLRELKKVRNRLIKQFVPETRDCRHKIVLSDYFRDEETLTAYVANFVKHFQSTHFKEEAISRIASWQSSLEAARKKNLGKKEEASYRMTTTNTLKKRTHESADREGRSDSSNKNSRFCADSEYFKGGNNVSRVIYVSPWWRISRFSKNGHWISSIWELWEFKKERPEFEWNSKIKKRFARIWQTINLDQTVLIVVKGDNSHQAVV